VTVSGIVHSHFLYTGSVVALSEESMSDDKPREAERGRGKAREITQTK